MYTFGLLRDLNKSHVILSIVYFSLLVVTGSVMFVKISLMLQAAWIRLVRCSFNREFA
jgi:hypothetical protein